MVRLLQIFCLSGLLASCGEVSWREIEAEIEAQFPTVQVVSPEVLHARWQGKQGMPLLLDVRSEEEFAVSHLPNARLALNFDAAQRLLANSARDREIVVYCSVGYRSAALAAQLQTAGWTKVRNLRGSLFAWANQGYPLFRGENVVTVAHPYNERWGALLKVSLHAYEPQ